MRHGKTFRKFGRMDAHRMAMMRNLAVSLLKAGKIETTVAKAKDLSRFVEKLITIAKDKNVASTRILVARLNQEAVANIFEIAQKMEGKNGGYTRVVKTWRRYGDGAETAIVEFSL